ncbi:MULTISPECIES: hypothetical protein [unclassified Saccharopolyspora]|uniref:hypothetical protein n=1 Tax=unclassified Saccharopolyspora TaxID=2646250 RepID=UPI001CD32D00|nr:MULTISPECIES: hypothetical protein [unclassified Saccharopolyspora]MCA1194167.1 hypothetical protein [Saccharopolyspora sp. 6V]MCA1229970.1 hypothetical protein [Saccharopolyspora sp. 6M]
MSQTWHIIRRRSWWDGSIEAWCGDRKPGGAYETDLFRLPRGGTTCPACTAAKKRGRA